MWVPLLFSRGGVFYDSAMSPAAALTLPKA
jgi:hypothetical protein